MTPPPVRTRMENREMKVNDFIGYMVGGFLFESWPLSATSMSMDMENELTNFNRLNREWYEHVIEQSRVQDGKNSMSAIIHLATKAFEKRERVKVLEALNLPADYEDRKRAFIELETARYEAIQAESALRSAQSETMG